MTLKLIFDIVGDITEQVSEWENNIARAGTAAMHTAGDGLKSDMRAAVVAAGLGKRLPNTIRETVYPKSGTSIDAAAFVWSNAPEILNAFTKGAVINAKHGRFLAIPTDAVKTLGGRTMKPIDFAPAGIPLRYVPPRSARHVGLLVMDNARLNAKGKAVQAGKRAVAKGNTATVVMFILVAQVTLRSRFELAPLLEKWVRQVPDLIKENLTHE